MKYKDSSTGFEIIQNVKDGGEFIQIQALSRMMLKLLGQQLVHLLTSTKIMGQITLLFPTALIMLSQTKLDILGLLQIILL